MQGQHPAKLEIIVMSPTTGKLGGARDLGVEASIDEVTEIEGLSATVGADLYPMQQARLDHDVAQCGHCRPGQIMAAVAPVNRAAAECREITDADLDGIRTICRCGTRTSGSAKPSVPEPLGCEAALGVQN